MLFYNAKQKEWSQKGGGVTSPPTEPRPQPSLIVTIPSLPSGSLTLLLDSGSGHTFSSTGLGVSRRHLLPSPMSLPPHRVLRRAPPDAFTAIETTFVPHPCQPQARFQTERRMLFHS